MTLSSTKRTINYNYMRTNDVFAHTIAIGCGKGGVGKTISVINFAMNAALMGQKVLIIDGDLGLANINVLLGIKVKYSIEDVMKRRVSIKDIIVDAPHGVKIIPSGSGIFSLSNLSSRDRNFLFSQISYLEAEYDLLLLDTGAGIGSNTLNINSLAQKRIVVTTPDPHSITDAYAFIKVLSEEKKIKSFYLVTNMTKSEHEGSSIATNLANTCKYFL